MSAPSLVQYVQGMAAVSADNLNSLEQTCDVFQQLRDLIGTQGMQVFTRGGDEIADGKQGEFYWNSTSVAADDNLNVIAPTGAGTYGRWLRLPNQPTPTNFIAYATYAAMIADHTRPVGQLAYVYNDPDPEKNTFYQYEADGWHPAPWYFQGVKGPKGDPGGNVMSIGLFIDAGNMTIPVGTDLVQTSGYSIPGIGSAQYERVGTVEPVHPGKFQDVAGQWFQIVGPVFSVDAFGALGNCPDVSAIAPTNQTAIIAAVTSATNDVAAFQAAFQTAQTYGGCVVTYGGHSDDAGNVLNYRVCYNTDHPGLTIGPYTTLQRVGGGWIELDPSTPVDAKTLPTPPNGTAWVFGAITGGDAYTGLRPTPYPPTSPNGAIFLPGSITLGQFIPGLSFIDTDIRCYTRVNWRGFPAASVQLSLQAIRLYFAYDALIQNAYVYGTPSSGMSMLGGFRRRMIGCTAESCGFGSQLGGTDNGLDMVGVMIQGNPEISSHDDAVLNFTTRYNKDEGVSFALSQGIIIGNGTCTGDHDRAVEGIFPTTATNGSLGGEIPGDTIIHDIIHDGLHANVAVTASSVASGATNIPVNDAFYLGANDNTTSDRFVFIPGADATGGDGPFAIASVNYTTNVVTLKTGISNAVSANTSLYVKSRCSVTPDTGNQGRVLVHSIKARNIYAVLTPFSFTQANGGECEFNDITLADSYLATSANLTRNAVVNTTAATVSVKNLRIYNSAGDLSTFAIAMSGNLVLGDVMDADIDAGLGAGILAGNENSTGTGIRIKNVRLRGVQSHGIQIQVRQPITMVEISDNDMEGLNALSQSIGGFIVLNPTTISISQMVVRRNRARCAVPGPRPICFGTTVGSYPVGAISSLSVEYNDWGGAQFAQVGSLVSGSYVPNISSSFDNSTGVATSYHDYRNVILGQRIDRTTAVPSSGTWGQGDIVDNGFPAAAGAPGWVCVTSGTFGALPSSTTATVSSGSRTVTLADATGLVQGSWINITGLTPTARRVSAVNGLTVTMSDAANTGVAGASTTNIAPVFKARANLSA